MPSSIRSARFQTLGEEIANSISHGIALIMAMVALPFLLIHAARHGDAGYIVGITVFTVTVLLLYFSSTMYHALPTGRAKHAFHLIEHSAIFLLIAGTYTPLTLGVLRGPLGWALFAAVWTLAIAGILFKLTGWVRHPILSTLLYLLMGWTVIIAIRPIWLRMPLRGVGWMIMGGMAYTVGVIFFASRLRYHHLIWHLFVMAGTTCHFLMIYWYGI